MDKEILKDTTFASAHSMANTYLFGTECSMGDHKEYAENQNYFFEHDFAAYDNHGSKLKNNKQIRFQDPTTVTSAFFESCMYQ